MNQRIWQIASGDYGRNYSNLFLDYDVMLIGPGRFGPLQQATYEKEILKGALSRGTYSGLLRFKNGPLPGDYVILRSGRDAIALGKIAVEGYSYNEAFDDVYGWDLQHTRRVVWQRDPEDDLELRSAGQDLFSGTAYRSTFTRVRKPEIVSVLAPLLENYEDRPLKDIPVVAPEVLSSEELRVALLSEGFSTDTTGEVCAVIERLQKLADWYVENWNKLLRRYDQGAGALHRPSEYEVIAHEVLPLLLALGWERKQIAVEWQRIDLAVFKDTPTTSETCVLACEAKGPGSGLQHARNQVLNNVDRLPLDKCEKVITTDRNSIFLYEKLHGAWDEEPSGYINLRKIRARHIVPPETSAARTLMALSPCGISETT